MKAHKIGLVVLMLLVASAVTFISCSKKQEKAELKNEREQQFQRDLVGAKVHSECLEYIYSSLQKNRSIRSVTLNSENELAEVKNSALQFSQDRYGISSKFLDKNFASILGSMSITRSERAVRSVETAKKIELSSVQKAFLTELSSLKIEPKATTEQVRNLVETLLLSEKYAGQDDNTFKILSFSAAIFVDSYSYWSVNISKWHGATRGFWSKVWSTVKAVAYDDAEGAALTAAGAFAAAATGVGAPIGLAELGIGAAVGSVYGAIKRA